MHVLGNLNGQRLWYLTCIMLESYVLSIKFLAEEIFLLNFRSNPHTVTYMYLYCEDRENYANVLNGELEISKHFKK